MAYLPRGVAQPTELVKHLNPLDPLLAEAGAVKWRYTIDEDWSGDPAIFFWITLSDETADPRILGQTARRIKDLIYRQVDPQGQWGLIPYFNFRSQSEQAQLKDEAFG